MSVKPVIHFAHANGVPSMVYQKLFDQLKDEYDVIYVPLIDLTNVIRLPIIGLFG